MIEQLAAQFSEQQYITWFKRKKEPSPFRSCCANNLSLRRLGKLLVATVILDQLVRRIAQDAASDALAPENLVDLGGQSDHFW
jgi:hypothetical protein